MIKYTVVTPNKDLYDIAAHRETNDTWATLSYSPLDKDVAASWRGKELVNIKDDGNGVDISFQGRNSQRLEYDRLFELYLLLTEYFFIDCTNMDVVRLKAFATKSKKR